MHSLTCLLISKRIKEWQDSSWEVVVVRKLGKLLVLLFYENFGKATTLSNSAARISGL